MAELGGAAIGGLSNLAAATIAHSASFSARHDQCYELQAELMERLSQNFEVLRRKEDICDTEYYTYLEMRERAKESARAYRESIRTYKDVALLNFLRKRKAKHQVRQMKEEMRVANQSLRDHYHDSMSECFDVSSIKGESGSRPGSALYGEFIREWADGVLVVPMQQEEENVDFFEEQSVHRICGSGSSVGNPSYFLVAKP
ncbi:unnamed protein product [Cyclocybe aegerita]|uniref:Uncharacterized protein n=1 Tax=Cyclocybe aegerita TaxID=1973307 RepID=A0A8S0W3T6_CYCAE|nr:unnamed protein product [Cyclocybe aegerita]